ncbi:hypothetical protein SSX86_024165 [Deinandra increscens subsp. villosa]|uniref:Ubiquitin-like protease family profile domain-containing protein n=1 Tax=Deinandra increscens subsp. villosa TaxID=3103831 RepID=A0AAP0GQC7_9ASTR
MNQTPSQKHNPLTKPSIPSSSAILFFTNFKSRFSILIFIRWHHPPLPFYFRSSSINLQDDTVFAMDELSGAVVTSYSMYLYEQIKNGSNKDHGICFVTPTATMNHDKKGKARNVDDSSRLVADRLGSRKNNDIVLVPYNPGRHWVLGVLDMKKKKCYYLDSIRPTSVNLQFKHIVDAAIGLYNANIGSKKASKFNWVNSACPLQPGTIECGYYVLKFMKEVVRQGLVVLEQNKIGGDSNAYTDADFDEIREEWLTYACNFIFMDKK